MKFFAELEVEARDWAKIFLEEICRNPQSLIEWERGFQGVKAFVTKNEFICESVVRTYIIGNDSMVSQHEQGLFQHRLAKCLWDAAKSSSLEDLLTEIGCIGFLLDSSEIRHFYCGLIDYIMCNEAIVPGEHEHNNLPFPAVHLNRCFIQKIWEGLGLWEGED